MFRTLRVPSFRLIFGAQLVSGLGDWLDFVAVLSLVAYTWHEGSAGLAAVGVASALPWVLLSPLAGVLADRLPRRAVMVTCDLARAATVLCYLLAHNLPTLLVLLIVKVSFSVLFSPAESATVRHTVDEDDLLTANALTSITTQATKVVGPALGGILFAAVGAKGAFVADAVSFLGSAAFLIWLRLPKVDADAAASAQDPGEQTQPSMRAQLLEGVRFVWTRRVLLVAIASMAGTMFLVFAFDTLTPLAIGDLGLQPEVLGYAMGLVGLGTAVGAALIGQWGGKTHPLRLMTVSQASAGTLVAVVGFLIAGHVHGANAEVVLVVVMVGIGFTASGLMIGYPTVLQKQTPPELMGRVAALSNVVPTALQLLAPTVGAATAAAFGVGPVFCVAGLALAVLGVVGSALPAKVQRSSQATAQVDDSADVVAHWFDPAEVSTAPKALSTGLEVAPVGFILSGAQKSVER